MTNTLTHIDKSKPPGETKFLTRQVLCGSCQFKCCNSPSLGVECTQAESEALSLPILFQQEGHCRCLTDDGCTHGEQRPVYCRLFPLQISPTNKVVVAHWALLNCPTPKHYEFTHHDDDGYHYAAAEGVRGPVSTNLRETITLDHPIEDHPTVEVLGLPALRELYGPDFNFGRDRGLGLL